MQLGNHLTRTITIQNTSRSSSATWTLHALPQQVSSSSSGAAKSDNAAQHAQQAAETANQGVPAVLQAKEQQLLQQLQDAAVTNQGAASEADESSSTSVAADVATAVPSENPFEAVPAAEEEEEELGCSLLIEPECGVLAAGASATVQVSTYPPYPVSSHDRALVHIYVCVVNIFSAVCCELGRLQLCCTSSPIFCCFCQQLFLAAFFVHFLL